MKTFHIQNLSKEKSDDILTFLLLIGVDRFTFKFLDVEKTHENTRLVSSGSLEKRLSPYIIDQDFYRFCQESCELLKTIPDGILTYLEFGLGIQDFEFYIEKRLVLSVVTHEKMGTFSLTKDEFIKFQKKCASLR